MKIIYPILIVALLYSVVWWIAERGLRHYRIHETDRLTEILCKHTAYDCLLLGNSRTHDHLNPRIIDSLLQLNSYNAGIDAARLPECKLLLDAYLHNHPAPRYVILGIEPQLFGQYESVANPLSYYPYLGNPVVRHALQQQNAKTLLYYYLPPTRLSQYTDRERTESLKGCMGQTIFSHYNNSHTDDTIGQYKGYLSNGNYGLVAQPTPPVVRRILPYQPALRTLDQMIATCQQRNISLILVYYPIFDRYFERRNLNHAALLHTIDSTAQQHQLPYLVHDTLTAFQDARLYFDGAHLNTVGATQYSTYLANQLLDKHWVQAGSTSK